jgi:8-hydroxy-5-deazaflavin:NADPH oxidoreductase
MSARNTRGRVMRSILTCAAVLSAALSWAPGASAQAEGGPLKIGIVGTGKIGGALAKHWAGAGHELLISSRHPEELKELASSLGPKVRVGTPQEAARFGDVILLSVPYKATPDVGRDLANEWKGKILLDTGNPYPFRDGSMATDARRRSTGVTSKEFLPGVRLVRAFNAINAANLANDANRAGGRWAIPLASDDAGALAVAQRLVRDAGFDPVVVGPLARAREFDVGTDVYTKLMTAKQLREALGLKE